MNQETILEAFPAVLSILNKWGCSDHEKADFLGVLSLEKIATAKGLNSADRAATEATALRMSHILNIHKSLRLLFSSEDSVSNWVNKPNDHNQFGGRSAMDLMLSGKLSELEKVSSVLKAYSKGCS